LGPPERLEVRAAPGGSVGALIVGSGLLWWFDPFFGPFGNNGWASRTGNGASGTRRPFDFLSNDRSSAVRRICLDEFQGWFADAAQSRAASAAEGDAVRWASEPSREAIHALAGRLADRVARELLPLSGGDGSLDALLDSWVSPASIRRVEALASRLASASQGWEASGAAMALLADGGAWGATPLPAATDDLPDPAAGASSSGGGPASPNLQSPASDVQSPTSDLSSGVMAALEGGAKGGGAMESLLFNFPPVANDDTYCVVHDAAWPDNVLWNDYDPENAPLTAALVSGPSHAASFSFSTDGWFTYTPDYHYLGEDQFTYEISDGELTDSAVATIYVYNTPPTAGDDSFTVKHDSRLCDWVIGNDYDADGDSITASLVSGPS